MIRVGVMGGTFDPFHLGHLAVARAAIACGGLDELVVVPSATPPHRGPAVASADDRLEMVRLGVEGEAKVTVSPAELEREGVSFTVDTLRLLAAERPGAELHLVLGWDAARDLAYWHEPREVLRLARLLIVGRPGAGLPTPAEVAAVTGAGADRVTVCTQATPDVSATAVRAAAASGSGLAGLLPAGVARHVVQRRLYARSDG